MKVQLLQDYRGAATGEKFYLAGIYDDTSPAYSAFRYWLDNGFAIEIHESVASVENVKRVRGAKNGMVNGQG